MNKCSKCKRKIKGLSFNCRYCHERFCLDHRLPEDHKCKKLKEYKSHNKERWAKAIRSSQNKSQYLKPTKYKISTLSKIRKLLARNKEWILVLIIILLILYFLHIILNKL